MTATQQSAAERLAEFPAAHLARVDGQVVEIAAATMKWRAAARARRLAGRARAAAEEGGQVDEAVQQRLAAAWKAERYALAALSKLCDTLEAARGAERA